MPSANHQLRIQNENALINKALPTVMHIDLNSCFAIIEQQANRLLRGRPVGVSAYDTPRGFVLAASYEAKYKGVKLGVNVEQSRSMAPGIVIMTPDPAKYREAHKLFKSVLLEYSPDVVAKSIDEFVLDLSHSPALRAMKTLIKNEPTLTMSLESRVGSLEVAAKKIVAPQNSRLPSHPTGHGKTLNSPHERLVHTEAMNRIGLDIKKRIAESLGEWVTVNIGIAPNRFLAKYAAGFDKPDGMTLIDHTNLHSKYEGMKLVDLPGINVRYRARLRAAGIYTPLDFLGADMTTLKKQVFKSINGYHWYMRLRGHEVGADTVEFSRKRIGHQYALKDKTTDIAKLEKLLLKLCEKTGRRMRKNNYYAQGIHLYLGFLNEQQHEGPASFENVHTFKSWHHGEKVFHRLYSTADIYGSAKKLLHSADILGRVRIMAVHVYDLAEWDPAQLSLFEAKQEVGSRNHGLDKQPLRAVEGSVRSVDADKRLSDAVDAMNDRYGEYIITPALMMEMQGTILDRVAFGQVRDV